MPRLKPITVALLTAFLLFGDGGTLLLRKQAGPLTISVFSAQEPLRAGPADLSVLVQKIAGNTPVLDAQVRLHLTQSSANGISEVFAPATHAKATNKLLYAAHMTIPAQGTWKLLATVESKDGSAEVAGDLTVEGKQPAIVAYWPLLVMVPLIIILFAINQRLKRRRDVTNRRARA